MEENVTVESARFEKVPRLDRYCCYNIRDKGVLSYIYTAVVADEVHIRFICSTTPTSAFHTHICFYIIHKI